MVPQFLWVFRRVLGLVVVGVLFGCRPTDVEQSLVAYVNSDSLNVQQLADLLVLGQPMPVDHLTGRSLAQHWLELAALRDWRSEAVEEARLQRILLRIRADSIFRQTIGNRDAFVPTQGELQEEYHGPNYRMLAHVLRLAPPETSPPERERQRAVASSVVSRLRQGEGWGEVVKLSEDPEGMTRGGLLGLVDRGELPRNLEDVAWSLPPGAFSPIVESDLGFHVLFRPTLIDVQGLFGEAIAERRWHARSAVVVDSLAAEAHLALSDDAEELVRRVAMSPFRAPGPGTIATYSSGEIPGAVVAHHIRRLPLSQQRGLVESSPDELRDFAWQTAATGLVREMVLRERSAPLSSRAVLEFLENLRQEARNHHANFSDSYLEMLVSRQREQLQVSVVLAELALSDVQWDLSEEAVDQAVALARSMLGVSP